MKKTYRVGVYRNAGSDWHGGQIYFDNLISLLSDSSGETGTFVELVLIEKVRNLSRIEDEGKGIATVFLSDYLEEEREKARQARKEANRRPRRKRLWHRFFPESAKESPLQLDGHSGGSVPELSAFEKITSYHSLDFVFPLPAAASGLSVNGAGWIPDLQHCFLPELFSPSEIETRNEMFRRLSNSGLIIFSSKTSRNEFRDRYPESEAKLEVWSFCGNPGNEIFTVGPSSVVKRYCLPDRFFLVSNQFWKHKDHALVVEALVRLKGEGLNVKVVFTGALRDYRGTGHVDEFLQSIQRGGIHENVHLLGFLDREEQWHLMRSALAVIQPSQFEGWSTVVEDCKAIGQRLILSDLAVHVEQAPKDSMYFPVGDACPLADQIRELWTDGAGEWLQCRETRESQARSALTQARAATRRRFLEIVESAQSGRV